MPTRVISGIVLAFLIGGCIAGGLVPITLGVFVLSSFSLLEFYRLMQTKPYFKVLGFMANTGFLALAVYHVHAKLFAPEWHSLLPRPESYLESNAALWLPFTTLFIFHFLGHFVGKSNVQQESMRYQTGSLWLGFLWISQTLGLAILFFMWRQGQLWLALAVIATVFSDLGGYYFGRAFGKHRLAPRISPGKTVEGLFGGIILSTAATTAFGFLLKLPWPNGIFLGLWLATAAVVGDLLESFWKRKMGVKDSGSLIPGHGGFLDRLDSHLLTISTLFLYLWLTK